MVKTTGDVAKKTDKEHEVVKAARKAAEEQIQKEVEAKQHEEIDNESVRNSKKLWYVEFTVPERSVNTIEKTLYGIKSTKYAYTIKIERDGVKFKLSCEKNDPEHIKTMEQFLKTHTDINIVNKVTPED